MPLSLPASSYTAVPSQTFTLIRAELLPRVTGQPGNRNYVVYADGVSVSGVGGEAQVRSDDSAGGTQHGLGNLWAMVYGRGGTDFFGSSDQLRAGDDEPHARRHRASRGLAHPRRRPAQRPAYFGGLPLPRRVRHPLLRRRRFRRALDLRRLQHPRGAVLGLQQGRLLQPDAGVGQLPRHPLEPLQLGVHVPGGRLRAGRRLRPAGLRDRHVGPARHKADEEDRGARRRTAPPRSAFSSNEAGVHVQVQRRRQQLAGVHVAAYPEKAQRSGAIASASTPPATAAAAAHAGTTRPRA